MTQGARGLPSSCIAIYQNKAKYQNGAKMVRRHFARGKRSPATDRNGTPIFARCPVVLCKHHLLHTIAANDIDALCSPYRVPAARTDIFPCTAGLRGNGPPGLASGLATNATGRKALVPAHANIAPALGDDEIYQCFRGMGNAPADAGIIGNI